MARRSSVSRGAFLGGLAGAATIAAGGPSARAEVLSLEGERAAYRSCLALLRRRNPTVRRLPPGPFFLFGAGPRRPKLVCSGGVLREDGGVVVRRRDVAEERIVPWAYTVELRLKDGGVARVIEDEEGLWVEEARGGAKVARGALARAQVRLPRLDDIPFSPVLRALHHEILVNVTDAGPLPNRFVYRKPWYRDAAMMAMVLERTGNLDVVREWILGLRDPFDRNNAGETEADNPGQLLFLVSRVSDRTHPAVPKALAALRGFETAGPFVSGRSDFASHPVYQTKWAKLGLRALGLPDPYTVPRVADSYSSLFWWDFKDAHVPAPRFGADSSEHWPYLVWAEDHFHGETRGPVGDQDWPLSWESNASQADYEKVRGIAPAYADAKLAAPHTWQAAEMFLQLADRVPGYIEVS